jgi:hypothetical protein
MENREVMTTEVSKKEKFFSIVKLVISEIAQFFKFLWNEGIKFPTYILFQPFKGFDEFKRYKRAKMSLAITYIVLYILLSIMDFHYSGFIVNQRDITELNTLAEIAYVIVPLAVLVVANWSVTTLFDGKGTMKDIFLLTSYALFPMIVAKFFGIFVSNIIVEKEVGLYHLIMGIGTFGSVYFLFVGWMAIHEYGLLKCVLMAVFTLVAAIVILFAVLLLFDLYRKIFSFAYTVYREITLRYF